MSLPLITADATMYVADDVTASMHVSPSIITADTAILIAAAGDLQVAALTADAPIEIADQVTPTVPVSQSTINADAPIEVADVATSVEVTTSAMEPVSLRVLTVAVIL